MGQLEKYGLYVLCLVIFLILGVTIWGGADAPQPGQTSPPVAINANPGVVRDNPVGDSVGLAGARGGNSLASLLQPLPRPETGKPPEVRPVDSGDDAKRENKPVEAVGNGGPANREPETSPAVLLYTIRDGDSFARIAKSQLGSEAKMDEIQRLNPGLDPRRLMPGTKIKLPSASASAKPAKEMLERAGSFRTYVIKSGDSFARIAKSQLGSEARFDEIARLNPDLDPLRLKPGGKVKLPVE